MGVIRVENKFLGNPETKVKVPGLSGIPLWFVRCVGKSHAKHGIIRKDASGVWKSPWIVRKEKCYHAYIDKQYELAASEITPWRLEAESAMAELGLMEKGPITSGNRENDMRQTASRLGRRSQLISALSTIGANLESLDSLLDHRDERARDDLMTHTCAYWEGALKRAGDELPPSPDFLPTACRSKEVYIQRKEELQARIKAALDKEEV